MSVPKKIIFSDLLNHRVRCDSGVDHGPGYIAWMHPPVHRLLGWISKPSTLNNVRHVWRLNQLRGIGSQEVYVKGKPSVSDLITIERLPTLLNADLLSKQGERLGCIADFIFNTESGQILSYLISRSDPRIPGTSRWSLNLDLIEDQQPGMVATTLTSLDELPLTRTSLREDIIQRSRNFRDQLQDFGGKATDRLEGWLEEPTLNSKEDDYKTDYDPLEDWDNNNDGEIDENLLRSRKANQYNETSLNEFDNEEDPWI